MVICLRATYETARNRRYGPLPQNVWRKRKSNCLLFHTTSSVPWMTHVIIL